MKVTIDGFTAGSVVVDSTVTFLSGVASSAQAYQTAMTSGDTSSIFGTAFGIVSVDAASVQATTVANPGMLDSCYQCAGTCQIKLMAPLLDDKHTVWPSRIRACHVCDAANGAGSMGVSSLALAVATMALIACLLG